MSLLSNPRYVKTDFGSPPASHLKKILLENQIKYRFLDGKKII
jgi:hypothetical protein